MNLWFGYCRTRKFRKLAFAFRMSCGNDFAKLLVPWIVDRWIHHFFDTKNRVTTTSRGAIREDSLPGPELPQEGTEFARIGSRVLRRLRFFAANKPLQHFIFWVEASPRRVFATLREN